MDFRILGPLEVFDGDRPLALGGAKQRALLALLLLHPNEVVSSDRLIEELWGERRLEDAAKALQVAVSRLRQTLEPDRPSGQTSGLLVTRAPGYQLCLEHGQLDLQRFQDQLADGRAALAAGEPTLAVDKLHAALALWRGAPLADVAYEAFAGAEIGRLEELHAEAVEDRIAAELGVGHAAELVAELEELVQRHPLRERLRGELMLALYRCGRQADALEVYQKARRALTEELGIEPSRELRELQGAILRQDSSLDPRPAREAAPESPRRVFVGREGELDVLVRALEATVAGRGRVVLVAGEPGIGKSRLVDELMGQARARAARVIVGRCWEAGGAPAYWPWVQSLRTYVRETDPEELRAQLGAVGGELAQLLPELSELFLELPQPLALESEGARFRLFEAVSTFLQSAAQSRPLVLVLDDLHAADEPSLLLLRFVARQIADSRLLVVCAFRDVDPTLGQPLTSALAELVREPQTAQIALVGLSEADVVDYIQLSTGIEPAAQLGEAIRSETEGNPLFVTELVHLLGSEGRMTDANAHLGIPPGVRAVIGQRLGRLSERCRSMLVLAAVMGREFGLDALARLSELPRHQLLDALDEAIAERIVGDVPASQSRLRFSHALIRDTLYDELSSARRLQLHHHAAKALEAVYSRDLEPHLAELAHHHFAAAPAGDTDRAIGYARRAGDRAASQLAYEEAARLYEMGLLLVAEDAARCQLLLALGDAQARAGAMPAAQQSFREAADLAERLGLPEQLAHAALGYGGRMIWEIHRGDSEYAPLLERALAALGQQDTPLRVRLLACLASGPLRDGGIPSESRALSEQALEMARRIGDKRTLAYALAAYNAANHSPTFTRKQVTLTTELIQLAMEVGDLERAAEGHEQRAAALIELGELKRAKADVAALAELADELRQPSQEAFAAAYRALLALLEGDFAEAEALIAGLRRVADRAQIESAQIVHDLQLYALRREQGRLEEVGDFVRHCVERYPTYSIWRCVLAQTASELGHAEEARQTVEALAADGFAQLPFDETWLASVALLAVTTNALRDADRASVLYELLLPYSDRVAISYAEIITGSVARYLGLLATTIERWNDAERHFEEALEANERIGARPAHAHTQHDYAQMLVVRDAPGDQARAQLLLSHAQTAYRQLGIAPAA